MPDREVLMEVLDLARWAPSGDNTQPWRFEIVSGNHVAVHGFDTRDWCLYDFQGRASYMAHGALLETIRIAATGVGCETRWSIREGCRDTAPIYDVIFEERLGLQRDPLIDSIRERTVQRRPMRTTPLTGEQRAALVSAVGENFELQFFESFGERLTVSRLLWHNAQLRLTCPEAYEVHARVIEWGARFSEDKIPEQAVGVDPATARLMRWVMGSWERVDFFNRYLLGTIPPRIQLDFVPGLACAAHILMKPRDRQELLEDFVEAGGAMQRLWLCVTRLGLSLQPEMTPLIFRWFGLAQNNISRVEQINRSAEILSRKFEALAGSDPKCDFAFFCRIGKASVPKSRSLRKRLTDLRVGLH